MIRFIFILLILPCFAHGKSINIENITVKPALAEGYSTSIYLDITNEKSTLDYLTKVEIIGHPEAKARINKTVIDKNIARIINIDRLIIPANSKVKLAPIGIFIRVTNLPFNISKNLKIKLSFMNEEAIVAVDKYSEGR